MTFLRLFLLGVIACNMAACGHKGRLKSPAQIEAEEQKKERREAKEAKKKAEETKSPSPLAGEGGVEGAQPNDKERTPPPNLPPQGGEE